MIQAVFLQGLRNLAVLAVAQDLVECWWLVDKFDLAEAGTRAGLASAEAARRTAHQRSEL